MSVGTIYTKRFNDAPQLRVQYWYDRSVRCWYAAAFESDTGYQVGEAWDAYTRGEIEEILPNVLDAAFKEWALEDRERQERMER